MLVSAILQHESAIGIRMSHPFWTSPPHPTRSRLSQSSLHHTTNSHWLSVLYMVVYMLDNPGDPAGKESACHTGDLGSMPGLGRSPGERESLSTLVFWPGEFHGLYSPQGRKESDRTDRFSLSLHSFHSVLSIHPTLSFPYCDHRSALYIHISVAVLHIGSSAPSF